MIISHPRAAIILVLRRSDEKLSFSRRASLRKSFYGATVIIEADSFTTCSIKIYSRLTLRRSSMCLLTGEREEIKRNP